jgi:lysozyme
MIDLHRTKATILRHEGLRLKPYHCPAGKLTIGIGRNIEDRGITQGEAYMLLETDLDECVADLKMLFPDFDQIDPPRQEALVNMRFQLGGGTLRKFRRMVKAVKTEDWEEAKVEALDSAWARQTPQRAHEVAEVLRTGVWH